MADEPYSISSGVLAVRSFVLAVVPALAMNVFGLSAIAAERPNIVLIVTDDSTAQAAMQCLP